MIEEMLKRVFRGEMLSCLSSSVDCWTTLARTRTVVEGEYEGMLVDVHIQCQCSGMSLVSRRVRFLKDHWDP